jgi:hypothetical protein
MRASKLISALAGHGLERDALGSDTPADHSSGSETITTYSCIIRQICSIAGIGIIQTYRLPGHRFVFRFEPNPVF